MSGQLSSLDIGKLKIKSAASAEERKRRKALRSAPAEAREEARKEEDFRQEDLQPTTDDGLFRHAADGDAGEDVAVGGDVGFLGSGADEESAPIDDLLVGALLEREAANADALFERTTSRTKAPDLADDGLDDDVFSRLEDATKDDDDDDAVLASKAEASPVKVREDTKEAPLIADDFDYEAYIASQAVSTGGGGLFEDD
mmetsp:Transcript_5030/g.15795  ORF Transcript_5030/g.15795 Transcript_5030/m.15795 type:complete len:200 (+) Transcript_5030:111-710(+)